MYYPEEECMAKRNNSRMPRSVRENAAWVIR